MKYIYVQPTMNMTGSENSLYQTLSSQGQIKREQTKVLTFSDGPMKDKLENLNVEVEVITGGKLNKTCKGIFLFLLSFLLIFAYGIKNIISLKKVKVVYLNTLMTPQFYLLRFFTPRTANFITHVREFNTTYPTRLYKLYFFLANKLTTEFVFCTGAILKQDCLKTMDFKKNTVIHNTSSFTTPTARNGLIAKDTLNIGFIGSTNNAKGIDRLINVIKKSTNNNIKVHAYVVGKIEENEYKSTLVECDEISLVGVTDNMENFYGSIDCLLMLSRTETFPRVIIESFNMAVPVIATDVGGVSEALQFGGGFLIPNEDSQLAFNVLDKLSVISNDYSLFSNEALLTYQVHFNPNVVFGKLNHVIFKK